MMKLRWGKGLPAQLIAQLYSCERVQSGCSQRLIRVDVMPCYAPQRCHDLLLNVHSAWCCRLLLIRILPPPLLLLLLDCCRWAGACQACQVGSQSVNGGKVKDNGGWQVHLQRLAQLVAHLQRACRHSTASRHHQ